EVGAQASCQTELFPRPTSRCSNLNRSGLLQRTVPASDGCGGGARIDFWCCPPGRGSERNASKNRGHHLPRWHVEFRRLRNELYPGGQLTGRIGSASRLDS